jgi:RNA-directed DNA polymerase
MKTTKNKRIPIAGSALYRITSPRRLANILLISRDTLERLVDAGDDNYLVRQDRKSGRIIEEPKPALKSVQKRFSRLLAQIETPDYLHSGVKGRSYQTNASAHLVENVCIKLDIRKFFPSVSSHYVQLFFECVLEYPPDVASRAKQLLTYGGHLPTGGNASTILSFWAYKPMFDEINELTRQENSTFTLYVDDISITGVVASRKIQHKVRKIINRYKLRAHKAKLFAPGQTRILTGVAITNKGKQLPYRRAKNISILEQQESLTSNDTQKLEILSALIGKLSEASTINPAWRAKKTAAIQRRRTLKSKAVQNTKPNT